MVLVEFHIFETDPRRSSRPIGQNVKNLEGSLLVGFKNNKHYVQAHGQADRTAHKGLEDFSANPVTLRGNILRMR